MCYTEDVERNPMKFEVGRTYTARSACDHNLVFAWTVTARTAKFITINDGDTERRVGVKVHDGNEWALPDGSYSMAPVINADSPVPLPYVTVFPADRASGWRVAIRIGDIIEHRRLNAAKFDATAARAEAEEMFPDRLVILPDDPKPWAA
jgi:hypothetical protein